MDVLVTGGAGFIGSTLAHRLVADGHAVRILDDLSTGSECNLERITRDIELVVGDLRDRATVERAVRGVEVVYHLGALPSVGRSVEHPELSHDVNAGGTFNVMNAARTAGVRRVVYSSSSSIYGDTPTLPKHEDMSPAPRSPYAAYKLAGELYCRAFPRVFGMEAVSLRFFNIFGPRQDPASQYAAVIPRWIEDMSAGRSPTVYGDGCQTRDFTYVDNAVNACVLAASAGPEANGEFMNIGCGDRISLLGLIDELNAIIGTNLRATHGPPRDGDVRDSQASISKAERLIGYRPTVSLREGLENTARWLLSREVLASRPA